MVATAAELAARVPIILLSLPSASALAEVTEGRQGIASSGQPGLIVIEASTLPLEAKLRARDALAASGQILLDCPVSGTGAQAAAADVVVFASGDSDAIAQCGPIFTAIGRRYVDLGAFGAGMKVKIIANHLVTIHNVAAGEAMAFARKAGLDLRTVHEALADSAGTSRMFQIRGPQMVEGRYEPPTATIRTHLKDLSIIDGFADSLDMPLPLYTAASQHYHSGLVQGYGELDTASVCAVSEALAGLSKRGAGSDDVPEPEVSR